LTPAAQTLVPKPQALTPVAQALAPEPQALPPSQGAMKLKTEALRMKSMVAANFVKNGTRGCFSQNELIKRKNPDDPDCQKQWRISFCPPSKNNF
jgi:hypothetical protein